MIRLATDWLAELGNGAVALFMNPLFYWSFLLLFLTGYMRIKAERRQFGVKIYDLFSEWKRTILPSIIIGIVVSLILAGAGVVFSYGSLIVLSLMMILLSINLKFTFLSPSYTIGLSYIVLLFGQMFLQNQNLIPEFYYSETNYIALTFLMGLLLIVEAIFIKRVKRKESFPKLVKSKRGIWIGEHHLKKSAIVPIFLLIPGGVIESFAPYWPLFSIGEQSYGLILFPFLVGFSHHVRTMLTPEAANYFAKWIALLGVLVIVISAAGYYLQGMSLIAFVIGILGREFITYRFHIKENRGVPLYKPEEVGLRILGIIPGTPADRLEIQVGEVITKVNDQRVNDPDEFYEALQGSGAYFKLEMLDNRNEIRFVQSAFYESDHYRLGLLFVETPHHLKKINTDVKESHSLEDKTDTI